MASSETVYRLPRSLEESFGYFPDWRARQVRQYETACADAANNGQEFALPDWEDDDEVIRYYTWKQKGKGLHKQDHSRFFYSEQVMEHNARNGGAARIRCLLIAQAYTNEIAARMGTKKEYIDTFIKLFFDIEQYLSNKELMSSLVFPFVIPRNEAADIKKERMWRTGAFLLGTVGFDLVTQKKLSLKEEDMEAVNKNLRALMAGQALDACLYRRSGPASPLDIELFQNALSIPDTGDRDRDGNNHLYLDSLKNKAIEVYGKGMSVEQVSSQVEVSVVETTINIIKPKSKSITDFSGLKTTRSHFSGEDDSNSLALIN